MLAKEKQKWTYIYIYIYLIFSWTVFLIIFLWNWEGCYLYFYKCAKGDTWRKIKYVYLSIYQSLKCFMLEKNVSSEHPTLSGVKQITSPGWMHETSGQGWCTGKTQRDGMEREVEGGIGMGNTCKSMADSCQCVAKPTTIL